MGALLSIPLLTGGIGAIGSSLFSGCLLFMGLLLALLKLTKQVELRLRLSASHVTAIRPLRPV
jgi:hypothetical protein